MGLPNWLSGHGARLPLACRWAVSCCLPLNPWNKTMPTAYSVPMAGIVLRVAGTISVFVMLAAASCCCSLSCWELRLTKVAIYLPIYLYTYLSIVFGVTRYKSGYGHNRYVGLAMSFIMLWILFEWNWEDCLSIYLSIYRVGSNALQKCLWP